MSGANVGSVLMRISSSTPSFANAEANAASAASTIALFGACPSLDTD
jgi:hypothetical protein